MGKVLEFVWVRWSICVDFVWGGVSILCVPRCSNLCGGGVSILCVPRCSNLCVPRCSIYVGVDAARLCGLLGRRNWAGAGWPVPWAVRCAVGQGFAGSDWRVSPLHILKDPLAVIPLYGSRTLTKSPYLSRTLWLSAHHTFCVRVLTAAAE